MVVVVSNMDLLLIIALEICDVEFGHDLNCIMLVLLQFNTNLLTENQSHILKRISSVEDWNVLELLAVIIILCHLQIIWDDLHLLLGGQDHL